MIGDDPSGPYLNRLLSICELLGSADEAADLLGENVSEVERWMTSGQVAVQSHPVVLDLEFLLVRASRVWSRETLMSWFRSENRENEQAARSCGPLVCWSRPRESNP